MNDEKNMFDESNEEENINVAADEAAAEEVAETAEETAEETTEISEDAAEENETFEDSIDENMGADVVSIPVPPKKEISKQAACAISVVVTLAVVAVAILVFYFTGFNRYNTNPDGYSDTLETYAKMSDKSIEEVMEELSLPSDMKPDTILDIAQFYIPAKKMADNYGMDMESLKKALKLSDEQTALITEETRWGEVTKLMREAQEAENAKNKASEEASEGASEGASESASEKTETESASEAAAE